LPELVSSAAAIATTAVSGAVGKIQPDHACGQNKKQIITYKQIVIMIECYNERRDRMI